MPADEVLAESSTANQAPGQQPEFVETSLDSLTDEQLSAWRLNGELPKAKPAEPRPAKKTTEAPAEAGEPKGTQETGKGKGVKARTEQLDGEIQELEARLARKADLKRQLGSETGVTTAPPAADPKTAELKAPVEPKDEDYTTWEELRVAERKYARDLAKYEAAVAVQEDRKLRAEESHQQQQEAESKKVADTWNKQVEAASKKFGVDAWNASAQAIAPLLAKDPRMAAGATFVIESEVGAEISHYLGTHLDEAQKIAALSPIKQIAALTRIEDSLTKPAAEKHAPPPGPKKHTEVPPPPPDLAGRNAPPKDAVEAARATGEYEQYRDAANARDIAARRRAFSR